MKQPTLWEDLDAVRDIIDRSDRIDLCLDFDGTLAPIAADPASVELSETAREELQDLAQLPAVDLAIVSGRSIDDIQSRVNIEGIDYAGNHGLEILSGTERWVHPVVEESRPRLQRAITALEGELANIPGVSIEDKHATATVHYRRTPSTKQPLVRKTVKACIERYPDLRVGTGKAVLQLLPKVDWNKGDAIQRIGNPEARGILTVFIGDDETDGKGFEALEAFRGEAFSVTVGNPDLPATYSLADPPDVRRWLAWVRSTLETSINQSLSV